MTAVLALFAALLTGEAIPTAHAAAFTNGAGPTGVYSVSCSAPADGGLANPNFDNQLFFKVGGPVPGGCRYDGIVL